MPTLTPGQIFLADRRLTHQDSRIRVESLSINAGDEDEGCAQLLCLDDVTLAAGQQTGFETGASSYLLLLPVTGAVTHDGGMSDVGQIHMQSIAASAHFSAQNTYAGDWINFLMLHIRTREERLIEKKATINYSLDAGDKRLSRVDFTPDFPALPFRVWIKQFSGREEAVHHCRGNAVFAFVIAGAFEAEGRLLHERDGLTLRNPQTIEFEALSAHAVLLLIEFF
ncbi:MAG: hypothetical protein INR69_06485 [Mucilaginibacter polytrichastri]|nr:hypothetical protein [Mucilaginibacter polytrichastri]